MFWPQRVFVRPWFWPQRVFVRPWFRIGVRRLDVDAVQPDKVVIHDAEDKTGRAVMTASADDCQRETANAEYHGCLTAIAMWR